MNDEVQIVDNRLTVGGDSVQQTVREWHKTLSQGVADDLRAALLCGDYPPGARLIEAELATAYGLSRGPLREALRRLEQEGLVQYVPRRGTFVTQLSAQDREEIYSLRLVLEMFAYRRVAATVGDEDVQVFDSLVTQMRDAGQQKDIPALVELDRRFHGHLVARSGHQRLWDVWENLSHLKVAVFASVLQEGLVRPQDIWQRHAEIATTFATQDPIAVEQILRQHYFLDELGKE